MANEISVRSQYTFMDASGTVYNSDKTYFSDATSAASSPKRYTFYAHTVSQDILTTGAASLYGQGVQGAGILFVVNRSSSIDIEVELTGTGPVNLFRVLGPGESMLIDVSEIDQAALGGGGSFTYASTPITNVSVITTHQEAKGELLFISKSAS